MATNNPFQIDEEGGASGSSELDRLRQQYQKYQTGGGQWQQYGVRSLQGMDLGGNNQANDIYANDNVSRDAAGYQNPLVQEAIRRGIVRPEDAENARWEIENYNDLYYEPGKMRTFDGMAGKAGRADGITGAGPEHSGGVGPGGAMAGAAGASGGGAVGSWLSSSGTSTTGGGGIVGGNRGSELYDMLKARATQGLNIDRNDPVIRGQADAYSANEERARRNYISDVAESDGPYANLQGEKRMAAERMGQRTGAFESELVGRELMAKRQEIAEALAGMAGLLTEEQRIALQRELGLLDNAIKQQGIGIAGRELDIRSQLGQGDLDLRRLLGERGLNDTNDRFAAQLGFDTADRASYWDLERRKGI